MHMNLTCMISTLSILVSVIPSTMSNAAEKITVSYSSRTYAFLPAQVAVAKGFFKDENLDPVLIQMRSQVTVPALLSGEVNYTLSFGNIIAGAMQGMPFKILAVLTDKPLHHIVARPEIKTIADLRGKRIGAQRIGGSDQLAAEAILQAKGLDLKEVQFVTLGADEPVRSEMLRKGLVDLCCSSWPKSTGAGRFQRSRRTEGLANWQPHFRCSGHGFPDQEQPGRNQKVPPSCCGRIALHPRAKGRSDSHHGQMVEPDAGRGPGLLRPDPSVIQSRRWDDRQNLRVRH